MAMRKLQCVAEGCREAPSHFDLACGQHWRGIPRVKREALVVAVEAGDVEGERRLRRWITAHFNGIRQR